MAKTSKAWMREHVTDPYVKRANAEGYRSRAAYKLQQIDAKDKLLKPGSMVVDLGEGKTQVFFQGLWYRNRLIRVSEGWRIKELVEEGYWNHNVPSGFKF